MLIYFMPLDYTRRARQVLVICKMGNRNATHCIDAFCKQLIYCKDITEAEAKLFFEKNMRN